MSIEDTGQLVNYEPIVDLVVQLPDESRTTLRTVVSKLRVPRPGEPGTYLYTGTEDA